MSKPMIQIHNAETGEIINREMNKNEFDQYKKDEEVSAELKIINEAQAKAKQALLDRLGITQDEAKLLLS
jgi:hypothetical protein